MPPRGIVLSKEGITPLPADHHAATVHAPTSQNGGRWPRAATHYRYRIPAYLVLLSVGSKACESQNLRGTESSPISSSWSTAIGRILPRKYLRMTLTSTLLPYGKTVLIHGCFTSVCRFYRSTGLPLRLPLTHPDTRFPNYSSRNRRKDRERVRVFKVSRHFLDFEEESSYLESTSAPRREWM